MDAEDSNQRTREQGDGEGEGYGEGEGEGEGYAVWDMPLQIEHDPAEDQSFLIQGMGCGRKGSN